MGAEAEARGRLVLMLSVLVILITAPIGAMGIAVAGPLLLTHDDPNAAEHAAVGVQVQIRPGAEGVSTEALARTATGTSDDGTGGSKDRVDDGIRGK